MEFLIIVKLCWEWDSNEAGKLVCLKNNNELYEIRLTKECHLKLILEIMNLVPKGRVAGRLTVNTVHYVLAGKQ